ncbi:MAG TPA: BTAD domain-containing putative transcriptional regulator, partial [Anaerolineae bacterium]|nr:BTAD domain-containing putative transcriptional regulator [Anaerolineae bacterium]
MARLCIYLLGSFHITMDGEPLTGFESNKVRALLAYLAVEAADRPHSRDALLGLLWPDCDERTARHNLSQALLNLRQAIHDREAVPPFLCITQQTVQFNPDSDYQLDTLQFEALLTASESHVHTRLETCKSCIQQLEQAIKLYRGEFLTGLFVDGVFFEEWALLRRERFHRLALDKLYHLATHYERRQDYDRARRYAQRQIELEPWREEAHRQLMRLLARDGQRSAALAQYEHCRRALAEELGIEPDEETQVLYERIRAAGEACPHNLPPQLTPFWGRTEELAEIAERLENPACRLLTLVGPGGIGKTRLALQAAAEQVGGFLNGVFFVPLVAVNSSRFLPAAIAEAIGLAFSGKESPQAQLLAHLRDKELLLVLDNFEHLLAPASEGGEGTELPVAILAQAPHVKLLITSREPLRLRAEWLLDVQGLAFPGANGGAALETYSAIRLFVESARRVHAGFVFDGETVPAVVQICQLLEGMPLGIELAAAAVRLYPCQQIAAQIAQDLDFLTTAMRDVPARHHSIRAVFDHSWRLLTSQEQAVFAQLAVFQGGFTPKAAQAVIEQRAPTTEHLLVTLADRSLIQRGPDGRYALHTLLRQYAAEKLGAAPEEQEAANQRHAAFYLEFLAGQGSGEEPAQRAAIRADLANIRAAWQWIIEKRDLTALERAAAALHNFYSAQSWFQEGIDVFQLALDQIAAQPAATAEQASLLCDLLGRQARMCSHIGQVETARAILEKARSYLPYVESAARRSAILGYLAITTYYAGDYGRAAGLAEESLRLSEEADDQDGIAFALNFLGSCAKAQGEYALARRYFEQAVGVSRQLQDGIGTAMALNNLGNLAQVTHDYDIARRYYRECSDLFKANDHLHGAATALANAGQLALKQQAYADARQLLTESLALKQQINDRRGMAVALVSLGELS